MEIKILSVEDSANVEFWEFGDILGVKWNALRIPISFSGGALSWVAPLTLSGKMERREIPEILGRLPGLELETSLGFESIGHFVEIQPRADAITKAPSGRDLEIVGRLTALMDGVHVAIRCHDLEIILAAKGLPEAAGSMVPNTCVCFTGRNFGLYWRSHTPEPLLTRLHQCDRA